MGDLPVVTPLVWPWLSAAVLGLVALVAAWALRARGRRARSPESARWVAHTEHLDGLPEVRRALRAYRVVRGVGVAALVVGVVCTAVLSGRPVTREVTGERLGTRDIVLCLDVSGSMVPFDSAIVDSFVRLVDGFAGERVALSVFSSSSRTVFPLTDDYPLVLEELRLASEALAFDIERFHPDDPTTWRGLEEFIAFVTGTDAEAGSSSLIGDGLASCALLFDEQRSERSRSIILATDNDVLGEPIYTLPEAVDLVTARQVDLYGLYGGEESLRGSAQNVEFETAVRRAGGRTWVAEDPAAVDAVLADITRQQAVALGADPQAHRDDDARPWFVALVASLLVLVLVRRQVDR